MRVKDIQLRDQPDIFGNISHISVEPKIPLSLKTNKFQ